ncbi:MAG: T9SS type A sorting domain-containing protein [Bacteroidetes bacterium]|nr:T9SS type A sorting domain-containing protein [Bacteroidota bacterium]
MKKLRIVLIISSLYILVFSVKTQGQTIYEYDGNVNGAPFYVDPNLNSDSLKYSLLNNNCPNAFSTYNFYSIYYDAYGDFSFNQNHYISLTLNPIPGYQIKMTDIQMQVGKSSSGPNQYFIAYSYDNGNSWLTGPEGTQFGTNCATWVTHSWDMADYTFHNQVHIRIYATSANSTGGSFYIGNLQINGEVMPALNLPQVSSTNGDIYSCNGQYYFLTSSCSDTSATPQWEIGTIEESSFTPLAGGNLDNLYVPVSMFNGNNIRLRVKYTHGSGFTYGGLVRFILESSPLPDIDAGNDTTIQVVCGTTSVQLNAIINSNSIDAFWWTDGDGVFDNTGSLNPVYTPGTNDISNGMAKLFCKTYSIFMCSEATDTVNVYFQLPEIFSSADTVILCQNQSVILEANAGFSSYLWNTGSSSSSISINSSGVYSVTVTLSGGCSMSDSIVVTDGEIVPGIIVANGPVNFCQGDSVTLSASPGYSYFWKKYGVVIPNANSQFITVKSNGSYKATLTSFQGCSKTTNKISIVVNPLPSKIVSASGPLQFCVGDSTVLQAESGTGYSYIWKKYGNVISGATDFQYTIKSSGKYKVIIENNFGCSRISQVKTVTVINCPDIFPNNTKVANINEVSVFPNPVTGDFINIVIPEIDEDGIIRINNLKGQEIKIMHKKGGSGNNISIDLSAIPNGFYLIQWYGSTEIQNGYFIINR